MRPLLLPVGAWLIGLAAAARLMPVGADPPPTATVPALGAMSVALLWLGRRASRGATGRAAARGAAPIAIALLALARHAVGVPDLGTPHIAARNDGGAVVVRGSIAREPDRRDTRTDYLVEVTAVLEEGRWRAARGRLLAQAARWPELSYGDEVRLEARLESPPAIEGFDYRAYLARKGIHSLARRPVMERIGGGGNAVRKALLAVKSHARRGLRASMPEPESALAVGIVLGDARGIPEDVDQAFRRTNTTHVIAISGSNIALLIAVLAASLGRLMGRRAASAAIVPVVAAYAALVGADAAVVRAAIMGSIVAVGELAGRPADAANGLLAAAWAMTAWNPGVLFDLGFQLSFAATVGLLAFGGPMRGAAQTWLEGRLSPGTARSAVRWLEDTVLLTLAAQLTTWPLIALQTGEVSLVALPANALIVPAQPAVMGLGALTAALGSVWPAAGRLVGAIAWLPTAWTIRAVEVMAAVPHAAVAWRMPAWLALGYYLSLTAWRAPAARSRIVGAMRRHRDGAGLSPRTAPAIHPALADLAHRTGSVARAGHSGAGIVAVAGTCCLMWVGVATQPDGRLHLHVLDVGQGDALLVVSPNGRRMLIDGGPAPNATLDGIGRLMAPWRRRLDVVVLTHPDADHVGGLAKVLEKYDVGAIVDPDFDHGAPDARAWIQARDAEVAAGAVRYPAAAGMRIVLDSAAGVHADLLWPPGNPGELPPDAGPNDASTVMRISYGHNTMLLTGDIEAEVESRLARSGAVLRSRVLKVAHHGSATSSTEDFIAVVRPELALISLGADNRFGHPDPGVLERLSAARIARTDLDGAIEIIGNGRDLWLRRASAER